MRSFVIYFFQPLLAINRNVFAVTLEPSAFAQKIARTNEKIVLRKSFQYLGAVIGIAFIIFNTIINIFSEQSPIEFYFTAQSILVYLTAYATLLCLLFLFTDVTTGRALAILNFSIGSGHLIQAVFIFIAFGTVWLFHVLNFIPSIEVDLRDWDNFDKTYIYFLSECASNKYFIFRFIFAGNQVLIIPYPFNLVYIFEPLIIFAYTVIAANIMRHVFGGSIWRFICIAIFTFIFTHVVWNLGYVYALQYMKREAVCGMVASRKAEEYTSESMLKKVYGKKYVLDELDDVMELQKIDVTKLHITKHWRLKSKLIDLNGFMGAVNKIKDGTQYDICTEEAYSNFRQFGVSMTEIYYSVSDQRLADFTVSANACSSLTNSKLK
jgi:hypothetical protein